MVEDVFLVLVQRRLDQQDFFRAKKLSGAWSRVQMEKM